MSGVMVQPMASPDWHPAMTKMPVPIVHLDIHCSEPGYYVAADNEAQGRIIAELAIARGAHHITVVGRAAFMQLTLRVLGIHKALALHPDIKIGRKGVQLLMEQIENKVPTKTKHIHVSSAARTVTAVTAIEDINRQELVRPFLLERASTQASSQTDATAINLGAYL